MLELPKRNFHATTALRQQVPLWIGLYGPSGGGKTYSALRIAKGIQSVQGGPVYGIDTEAKRMLHYADAFEFQHVPFEPPYGSLDYLAAIQFALKDNRTGKRPTIIIDSMSHEHEGPGGMIDLQEQIATRMATWDGKFDAKKYERVKMLAWAEPKAKRRALINGMLGLEANFILCFRAKESSVPVQKPELNDDGTPKMWNGRPKTKSEVVKQGFVPIGGDDFIYECTLAALLLPGARGKPTWTSDLVGERKMIKLPEQFLSLEQMKERPFDEKIGADLARWADGGSGGKAKRDDPPPQDQERSTGGGSTKSRAEAWVEWLETELKGCKTGGEVNALEAEIDETMTKLKANSEQLHKRAKRAIDQRMIALDMGNGDGGE